MTRIVVVGSVNMDLVTTVDRRPAPGETVRGSAFTTVPGGKGANQAVAAQRAGANVEFVGAVGDDEFGAALRAVLADAGVSTSGLRTVAGPSGTASIVVDGSGENTIIVVGGANAAVTELTATDLDLVATADILLCQLEIPVPTVLAAARHARAHGTVVVLNPSPVAELPAELWAAVDVAVVNEGEAAQLDSALASVPYVVTTLGGRGAALRGPHTSLTRPGLPVAVLDTTGAGDAFTGALAARWPHGPQSALEWACTAGALATTKLGAIPALPDSAAIAAALPR
ncbi:ribokinase [Nocardia stercoris]|uniref:Ribokinase n=1 Tax=Nocardia stercoris TaxID=2483361 RepID=A0A3M2L7Q3_9NOCA|nr:ribokinase [Nocardia stercoris]RMI33026.1 ribokinase [Nocardia stercoris]